MGFKFASFGAATVPLSKIIIDKDLDMGPYAIKTNMINSNTVMGQYRPNTWETETIQYRDTSPRTVVKGINKAVTSEELVATWTCDSSIPRYVYAKIPIDPYFANAKSARIAVNGVTVYTTGVWASGTTKTTDTVPVEPGDVFELYVASTNNDYGTQITGAEIVDTGFEAPVNINLQGRFLALQQDFGGLTATLTFGVEENVPFTEYVNRFPCAPDKITFNTQKPEDRPVIKIYKGYK